MWKAIKAAWHVISAFSTATWLWGLPWATVPAVIAGYWAVVAGLPLPVVAALALGVGVVCYAAYVIRLVHRRQQSDVEAAPATAPSPPPKDEALSQLPLLEQYFFKDFKQGPRGAFAQLVHEQELTLAGADETITIKYLQVLMFDAHAKLLAVFIPFSPHTVEIALHICQNVDGYMEISKPDPAVGGPGHEEVRGSELKFTGKVFLYHESALKLADRGKIDAAYRERGLALQMRSLDYALHTQTAEELNDKAGK